MDAVSRRGFLLRGALAVGALGAAAVPSTSIEPFRRSGAVRIKLSCCAYSYRQFLQGDTKTMTLEGFVDRCAEMGLDGVELTSYYFPADTDTAYLNRLKRRVFLQGLEVSGTAIGGSFTVPPGPDRDKQIALAKTWIDRSVELGAPCMRVFAGSVPSGAMEEQARQWCLECIEQCCEYASKRGVMLALENHGGITSRPEQVLAILKAVSSEWFGLNLDTGNFRGADPYADMAQVAQYAVNVHVKTEVSPAGRGAVAADFGRIVGILRSVGYRGYMSVEYEARENPMTAVPKCVDALRKALGS
ncbi:MAG: sugar phosphate isomerase/epimerase family protein [Armatimonadota bacterium]